jgi:serine/threonine protein kinase
MFDVFFDKLFCYMVMEKCDYSLFKAIDALPDINERSLGYVFVQMLSGISHCHSVNVMHRDIKPDNFLVSGEAGKLVVKLADFGLSAFIVKDGKMRSITGTAPYMCPEMLKGDGYDAKADVWSLGVIVYALMFGIFPYMPMERGTAAMKQLIMDGTVRPSFEQVKSRSTSSGSPVRSDTALSLVKALLARDPLERPTAKEALRLAWIKDSKRGLHMPGSDLPCLRHMFVAAQRVGLFSLRSGPASPVASDTPVDGLLKLPGLRRRSSGGADVDSLLKQLQHDQHGDAEGLPMASAKSAPLPATKDSQTLEMQMASAMSCTRASRRSRTSLTSMTSLTSLTSRASSIVTKSSEESGQGRNAKFTIKGFLGLQRPRASSKVSDSSASSGKAQTHGSRRGSQNSFCGSPGSRRTSSGSTFGSLLPQFN